MKETTVSGEWGYKMDLKKGLANLARGYLFLFLDLTLDITDLRISIDILPNFLGWIFIFIAIDCLGEYITNKSLAKWTAMAMVFLSLLDFYLWPESVSAGVDIIFAIINVVSTLCLYTILGGVEKIARDFDSNREYTIRKLKRFMIVMLAAQTVYSLFGALFFSVAALFMLLLLVIQFIYSISLAVNLYRLRDEVIVKMDGYYY